MSDDFDDDEFVTYEEHMPKISVPTNLDEAMSALSKIINVEARHFFHGSSEKELIANTHHTLGQWMRNEWGLWLDDSPLHMWFKSHGINHADDMSGIILISFWRKVNNKPIDLEGQIKYYQDYWKTLKCDKLNDLEVKK